MHINFAIAVGSAVVGFLVGLTGMGGGALMTPMLVIVFGITPSAAISSDLVAALFMKPFGVGVHLGRKTIQWDLVKYLCLGSVPAAFLGTFTLHALGTSKSAEKHLQEVLGAALILGAAALISRIFIRHDDSVSEVLKVKRFALVSIGLVGGFMVGLTSVGAGSLIIVLLLMIYPHLRTDHLVGTDLAQSIPLTASATFGAILFGHVHFGVTTSIIIGAVPAVIIGALLSSHDFTRQLRPFIGGVALLSGLKYVGVPVHTLGFYAVVIFIGASALSVYSVKRAPTSAALELEPQG